MSVVRQLLFVLLCGVLLMVHVAVPGCGQKPPEQEAGNEPGQDAALVDKTTTPDKAPPAERPILPLPDLPIGPDKRGEPPPPDRPAPDAPPADRTMTGQIDRSRTGSKANDYLKAAPYTSLLIEIDYHEAAKPSQRLLDTFKKSLEELKTKGLLRKSAGITVKLDQVIPPPNPKRPWTVNQLQDLEKKYRQNFSAGTQAAVYFLFVSGNWHEDDANGSVLGVAYSGSTMTMFLETIQRHCNSAGVLPVLKEKLCNIMEATTMVHEFGHILGLVNIGLKLTSQHEDSGHKGHCDNKDCVMYWANNKSNMSEALRDSLSNAPPVIPFGKECLDDMAAVHK